MTVAKVADAAEGGASGLFRFTRVGDLNSLLTVNYTVTGTATGGTDYYTLSGTIMFEYGEGTADLDVAAIDDNVFDPDETVVVTLGTGTDYLIGEEDEAEVVIVDSVSATFTLDSYVGAIKYTIPWGSVDPDEATQSLTATTFNLNIGGQNFAYGVVNYTTAPTLLFEYGDLVGIVFDLDLTGTGSSFASISVANGIATAFDTVTQQFINAPVAEQDPATLTLDFSSITLPAMNGMAYEVRFNVQTRDNKAIPIVIEIRPGATAASVRDSVEAALTGAKINVKAKETTRLVIQGSAESSLKKVTVSSDREGFTPPTLVGRTRWQGDNNTYPEYVKP